jgi:hypothetical protein
MAINLYYKRIPVGYTVQYRDDNNNVLRVDGELCSFDVSAEESKLVHGQYATASLDTLLNLKLAVAGYQLADPDATTVTFQLSHDKDANILVFYYVKTQVEIFYEIVCDDPNSGAKLSNFAEDKLPANSDGSTLKGSTPIESATYYFAGWYKDKDCTVPVTGGVDGTNHLLPQKTTYEVEDESGVVHTGELYMRATYYALFLPRSANLEVTVNSGQGDSFILTFVGQEGTFAEGKTFTVAVQDGKTMTVTDVPIGTYTVKSDAAWSWRYAQINTTVDVVVQDGGELTLNVSPTEDKWLTDDASATLAP